MSSTDNAGINTELLGALPPSLRILELGCADGRLGRRYKELNPGAFWTGVDINERALSIARGNLDAVFNLDLERDSIAAAGSGFDLIVLGDVLEHLKNPEKLLTDLHALCGDGAHLAMCMPNLSHISVLERFLWGDIMYDRVGLLDATHVRLFSPRSVFKMLLDCGWLPAAAGEYTIRHGNARFEQKLIEAARALGIPKDAAEFNINTYQLVIRAKRGTAAQPKPQPGETLTVVIPVTNETQAGLNVIRSPGLHEIGARFLPISGAKSAAAAFAMARERADTDWLLLCRQEVYVPKGSGHAMCEALQQIPTGARPQTVVGFAGIELDRESRPRRAGLMVDRFNLHDFPASERAASIDDIAVLLNKNCPLAIDPELSFDFWATDLCLQALGTQSPARIVRVPIFYNCVEHVPDERWERWLISGIHLSQKYPQYPHIPTLRVDISPREGLQPATFANA